MSSKSIRFVGFGSVPVTLVTSDTKGNLVLEIPSLKESLGPIPEPLVK